MAGIPQSVSQGCALKSFDAVAKLTCTADVASDNVTSSVFKKVTRAKSKLCQWPFLKDFHWLKRPDFIQSGIEVWAVGNTRNY